MELHYTIDNIAISCQEEAYINEDFCNLRASTFKFSPLCERIKKIQAFAYRSSVNINNLVEEFACFENTENLVESEANCINCEDLSMQEIKLHLEDLKNNMLKFSNLFRSKNFSSTQMSILGKSLIQSAENIKNLNENNLLNLAFSKNPTYYLKTFALLLAGISLSCFGKLYITQEKSDILVSSAQISGILSVFSVLVDFFSKSSSEKILDQIFFNTQNLVSEISILENQLSGDTKSIDT